METNGEKIDVNNVSFHPVLKDIENIFWFFILSNKALSHPVIQNILKQERDDSILAMLKKYNEWVELQVSINNDVYTSKLNMLDGMIFLGRAMTILTYELLTFSDYKDYIAKLEEFKFLKLIRNGAAHNNKIDLKYRYGKQKGQWRIGENETIKWRDKEISRKLHDTIIFNDFIYFGYIFLLAKDLSDKLFAEDSVKK